MLTNSVRPIRAFGDEEQLCLELSFSEPAQVIPFTRVRATKKRHLAKHDVADSFGWSDDNVETLRERLLIATLKDLTNARSREAKVEALKWVLSDDEHPFSFKICANSMALDHEEIRARVLWMMRRIDEALVAAEAERED